MERYPAHIRINDLGEEHVQPNADHCRQVAAYAAAALENAGLFYTGKLAGLIHDAGKFSPAFSDYIYRAARGENVRRGSVNHTFAGVRLLFERYFKKDDASLRNLACELIAFAAGAHHGLFDCVGPDGRNGFVHRLEAGDIPYGEVRESFISLCAGTEELDGLFEKAAGEITTLVAECRKIVKTSYELLFCVSLICRLVLSAVIDGDRRDTAAFMHNVTLRTYGPDMRPLWGECLSVVKKKLNMLAHDTQINEARREISIRCRDFPAGEGGIYRLSVPTGSGKTLSALRFALKTAQRHNKSRIFFVIPLLSILDQNAKVIRQYLECDDMVLEHHSNILRPEQKKDELDDNELLTETWGAPVVITTLVQLLNTLFRGETTCIRRFNALTGSVIVIDEVQSLPRHMITQFNLAMNFLSGVCRATVVLCSATQPGFETAEHPISFSSPRDMVPYDNRLFAPFRRTEIVSLIRDEGYTYEELAALALEKRLKMGSVLIICNKKDQAAAIFRLLCRAEAEVFHLSTSMCMAHREETLSRVNAALGKKPVICVSTQLVEAGVDFSFGCVIRVLAGVDNIVQAAGRCNRGGEFLGLCSVYIVNIRGENLKKLQEIQQTQDAARALLTSFAQDPGAFNGALDSEKAIAFYYRALYKNMRGLAQDYPIRDLDTTLFMMLSNNDDFRAKSENARFPILGQAFMTAGAEFKVFGDHTADVLTPYGEGEKLISDLCSKEAQNDFLYRKALLEKAKRFTVSIFEYQKTALTGAGGLVPLCGGAVLSVLPAFYREDTGLDISGGLNDFQEV